MTREEARVAIGARFREYLSAVREAHDKAEENGLFDDLVEDVIEIGADYGFSASKSLNY
jgi:hypothetical protein